MEKIDIKDYFIEIIDEGRSTIGYGCVPYKTNELVHKIYKQNGELKRLEQENAELKEIIAKNNPWHRCKNCNKDYKQALEEIKEYIGTCCHRFSSNHKNLCYGCEYDKEVCDYSVILDKINEVLGAE